MVVIQADSIFMLTTCNVPTTLSAIAHYLHCKLLIKNVCVSIILVFQKNNTHLVVV